MAAASNRFELEAEIVDKFTRPIRDFQHALSAINAPKSAQQIKKDFDAVQRSVARAGEAVGSGLRRALDGLGIASIGASMGLLAAFSAIKSFSSSVGELRAISRETGFSINTMRTLEAAAKQFQIAPEAVRSGLKTFSENLYDFRRQFGESYAEILKIAPDLAASLKNASPDKAVDIALDYIARIKDRITAGRVAEVLFGNKDIARFGQDGVERLKKALAEVRARIGDINPMDDQKAKAFSSAVKQINDSMSGLQKTLTIELAPALTDFAQWADRFIRANSKQIKTGLETTFRAIGTAAKSINDVVENSIGWDWLIKGILLAKLGETAGGMLKFGAAFAILGRSVSAANMTGLLAILSGLAAVGIAFGAFRAGASEGKPDASGAAKDDGRSDAGASPSPSPSSSTPSNEGAKSQQTRNETKLGSAVQAGVAKGVSAGLEAVSNLAKGGGSGAGFGGSGGLGGIFSGGAGGGHASVFDAARRGRMVSGSLMQGKAVGGWWTKERQKFAIDYLMKHAGLSEAGAAGLVARWAAIEASGGPSSVNPKSGAEGIAQWLGSRKRPGVTNSGNFEKNLEHAAWELNNTEKAAAGVLRRAKTPWEGALGASMFERAEGYNARSGVDNFTARTPADRVLQQYRDAVANGQKKVEESTKEAFKAAKDVGFVGSQSQRVPLFVRLHGAPRSTKISVDPGSEFSDAKVSRERGKE